MSQDISFYVENIDEVMDTYTQLKVFRSDDDTPTGNFTTQVGSTATLAADTRDYEFTDTGGTADSWYRAYYYNPTGPLQSDWSPPWRVQGATAAAIIAEAARRAKLGFAGACSAIGDVSYLVDAALRDVGVDSNFLKGGWLYRPAASAADMLRRVSSFTVASGRLVPSRDWAVAPASGEAYQCYMGFPPYDVTGVAYSWLRVLQDGLASTWIDDQVIIAEGDGTTTRFPIANKSGFLRPQTSGGVYLRGINSAGTLLWENDLNKLGSFTSWVKNGEDMELVLPYAPATSQYLVIDAQRRYSNVYDQSDVTDCPFDLAVEACAWQALWNLNDQEEGKWQIALDLRHRKFLAELSLYQPDMMVMNS